MGKIPRVGSLEIDQDLEFERREWAVQRAGWVVFLLILAVGFLGFLGNGPVSHADASSEQLHVRYERFMRNRAQAELRVQLAPNTAQNGTVTVWLDQSFLDKVEILNVLPEPAAMSATTDRLVFHFTVDDPDQPNAFTFQVQPSELGMMQGRVGLVDGPEVSFRLFIYP